MHHEYGYADRLRTVRMLGNQAISPISCSCDAPGGRRRRRISCPPTFPALVVTRWCSEAREIILALRIIVSFLRSWSVSASGPDETRTRDLRHARAALSRLSYGPWKHQKS